MRRGFDVEMILSPWRKSIWLLFGPKAYPMPSRRNCWPLMDSQKKLCSPELGFCQPPWKTSAR